MQSLVSAIVMERKESVIDSYQVVREHELKDQYLHKWIRTGLQSLRSKLDPKQLTGQRTPPKTLKTTSGKLDFWPPQKHCKSPMVEHGKAKREETGSLPRIQNTVFPM